MMTDQEGTTRDKPSRERTAMKVVHCKREPYTVYIGRPSVLGNPFVIGKDGTRDDVIDKFERWARYSSEVMETIERLPADSVLGCWCKPNKPCHGDVIVKLWLEMHTLC